MLVDFFEGLAGSRDIQIIATTQSGSVLAALSEKNLMNAVLCARIPDVSGTILKRFEDIPHLSDVLQRKYIDELFVSNWLEFAF